MQARQRTFMLLPDWTFTPTGPVALGRIVPINKTNGLPAPAKAFSRTSGIDPPADRIHTQVISPWEHDTGVTTGFNGGVTADLSLFTGLGGGVQGNTVRQDGFSIKSQSMERLTFYPSSEELAEVVKGALVRGILKKPTGGVVWLVTGIMVADGAEIDERTGRNHGGGPHLNADLTSVGVPLNAGVNAEWSSSTTGNTNENIQGKLLVGYQLLRIKKKMLGRSTEFETETKFALYDDEANDELEEYDFDLVAPLEEGEAGTAEW